MWRLTSRPQHTVRPARLIALHCLGLLALGVMSCSREQKPPATASRAAQSGAPRSDYGENQVISALPDGGQLAIDSPGGGETSGPVRATPRMVRVPEIAIVAPAFTPDVQRVADQFKQLRRGLKAKEARQIINLSGPWETSGRTVDAGEVHSIDSQFHVHLHYDRYSGALYQAYLTYRAPKSGGGWASVKCSPHWENGTLFNESTTASADKPRAEGKTL
jgi:hypothetical protein